MATASHHLQQLKHARLVSTEKRGKYRYDPLANRQVFEVWKAFRELGFSQNAEIERLKGLPKNKEIAAYCRGPLCTMADRAVALLRQNGYRAVRLDIGYPEREMKETAGSSNS